jgi:hypothetical protein
MGQAAVWKFFSPGEVSRAYVLPTARRAQMQTDLMRKNWR